MNMFNLTEWESQTLGSMLLDRIADHTPETPDDHLRLYVDLYNKVTATDEIPNNLTVEYARQHIMQVTIFLTDGVEITNERTVPPSVYEELQRRAKEATDGDWWWCIKQSNPA